MSFAIDCLKVEINERFDEIERNQRHIAFALKVRLLSAGSPYGHPPPNASRLDPFVEAIARLEKVEAER